MACKKRVPMQVSPAFETRIKQLQSDIMKKEGKVISLRDLTEKVVKNPSFDDLEKAILNIDIIGIKLNLDRRGKK
jgi:hypothetical protein